MSLNTTVKRQYHLVHQCSLSQKLALLKALIKKRKELNVLIVKTDESVELDGLTESENVTIMSDEEVAGESELKCDVLISYNLPQNAEDYLVRLACATQEALILLDTNEQKQLHAIERLLGRSLIQEIVPGFEPTKTLAEQKRELQNKKYGKTSKPFVKEVRNSYPKKDDKKPYNSSTSNSKRKPRVINVKSLKPE